MVECGIVYNGNGIFASGEAVSGIKRIVFELIDAIDTTMDSDLSFHAISSIRVCFYRFH